LLDGAKSIPQEKIVDLVKGLFQLSNSESIPPAEVPAYVTQKMVEKQKVEQEIQKSRAILDQENVGIRTIEEYKTLEGILKSYRLSKEDPRRLISVLQKFNEMGYDPQKIVISLTRLKSFRQTERRLKKNCKIWESRVAQYKEDQILKTCKIIEADG